MARLGRKPVRPGRVTIAVSVGAIGLFVISMAAGLGGEAGGWPVGAVGAALVIIAVALLTTASMRGSDKAFLSGTVHVVQVSDPPLSNTEFGRCEMQVLIDSPGHPGQTVIVRDPRVPVVKWPEVGDTLPALIAVSDARRVKIQWDRIGAYSQPYDGSPYEDSPYGDDPDIDDPEDLYLDDDDGLRTRPRDPAPDEFFDMVAAPVQPLPRRQPPSGAGSETRSVAVLEGELIPAEVTPAAQSDDDDNRVDALDFSDIPEPPAPTPQHAGPVFSPEQAPQVLPTQPQARPASAGSIQGIGVTVLVTDLPRSLRFYHDMLGFYEIDSGGGSAVLASGDTRLVLMTAPESTPVHKRLVHLNLEVGDVDAVYRELKVRGVRFTAAPRVVNQGERLELVAASFKDPDGHGIAIIQWKARTD